MTTGGWFILIIVGVLAGLLAMNVRLWRKEMPGGWIVGIVSGLVGAYAGGLFLGRWGWMVGGLNVIGGIIGALVIPYLVEAVGPKARTQS